MKRAKLTIKSIAVLGGGAAFILLTAIFLYGPATHTDPFANAVPRKPCSMRSDDSMVRYEQTGAPAPAPQNPAYCQQPVCRGTHRGSLITRYDNKTLLQTGTATLDIATDDGSPLGMIGMGPVENVSVSPDASGARVYSPDSTARFTLTGKWTEPDPHRPSSGFGDVRYLSYPLTIEIRAWCGQHSYETTVHEDTKLAQ